MKKVIGAFGMWLIADTEKDLKCNDDFWQICPDGRPIYKTEEEAKKAPQETKAK